MDDEQVSLALLWCDLDGDDLQLPVALIAADVGPTGVALHGRHLGRVRGSHDVSGGGPANAVAACRLREPDLHLEILSDSIGSVQQN